jgi:hypothetical protein
MSIASLGLYDSGAFTAQQTGSLNKAGIKATMAAKNQLRKAVINELLALTADKENAMRILGLEKSWSMTDYPPRKFPKHGCPRSTCLLASSHANDCSMHLFLCRRFLTECGGSLH